MNAADEPRPGPPVPPVPAEAPEPAPSSAADDEAGASSAGDSMVTRLVVDRGLATREEVDACIALREKLRKSGRLHSMDEVLVAKGIVTDRQLARLRRAAEKPQGDIHISGYHIHERLGAGAMGAVYHATQLSVQRPVALKVLAPKYSSDAKYVELLREEARATGRLNHPHIVGVIEAGIENGTAFIVMEYVDGGTVNDLLAKEKRLPEERSLQIARQMALALEHAHSRGFVHRDVKPKNIMLTKGGTAKLADLGLARPIEDEARNRAEAGQALGTPYYISPEQAQGQPATPRSDLYSLGITLYHMLTGRLPFQGNGRVEVMRKHIREQAIPPDHLVPTISQSAAEIVEMLMQKSPPNRYSSAAELVEDIDLALGGRPTKYARRAPDLGAVPVEALPEPTPVEAPAAPSIFASTAGIVATILLAASIIANIVLGLLLFGRT